MPVNIRFANQWDAPQLARWWKEMVDEKQLPGMSTSDKLLDKALAGFNDCLKQNGSAVCCLVAEVDDRPVGFMHSFIENNYWGTDDKSCHVAFSYVEKDCRHLQVGKKLGASVETFMINAGCKFATMAVRYDTRPMRAYTELNGLVPTYTILRKDF